MIKKILSIPQAITTSDQMRKKSKTIVLAGGCFDIIHIGHIEFLKKAKSQGDYLFVLLECDRTVREIKGTNRPINTQHDRASVLSNLIPVDYVIPLPFFPQDKEYDSLTKSIKPAIIATTKGDKYRFHKERQAKAIGAKVVDVVETITNQSTTKIVKLLNQEL